MASSSFHEEETDDGFVSAVRHESPQQIPAAPRCTQESLQLDDGGGDESEDDDDFEFAFVIKDPEGGQDITADEIFADGQIRPVYPVFGRALLLADDDGLRRRWRAAAELEEERATSAVRGTLRHLLIAEREENLGASSSSSSLAADELAGVPPGTYCVWAPRSAALTPTRCKKSRSTGSSSLRWRLRDLVVGRSHSDGKEKFVFLAAGEDNDKEKESRCRVTKTEETGKGKEEKAKGKRGEATEVDIATAHRIYYGSRGGARRSFLPYKQDLLGFFANVNGL